MLLIARGKISQTPVVPTLSMAPVDFAAASTASAISAAARNASRRSGISTAPACPPLSFNVDPQAGRRRDRRHHTDRQFRAFQQRTLLDMQFDKRIVIVVRQPHLVQIADESRALRTSFSVRPSESRSVSPPTHRATPTSAGCPDIQCRIASAPPR